MNTSSRLCFANETLYASPFDPLVDGTTWRTLCTNHFSNISCALVSFAEWYSSFKNIVNHTLRYANQLHSITKSIDNKLDLENTSSQTLSLTNAACHRLLSSLIRIDFTWPNRVTYSLCPSRAHSRRGCRVSRSMSHSGAWQVSAEALVRTFATRARIVGVHETSKSNE